MICDWILHFISVYNSLSFIAILLSLIRFFVVVVRLSILDGRMVGCLIVCMFYLLISKQADNVRSNFRL